MNNEQDLLNFIQALTNQRTQLEFQVMVLTKKLNELTNTTEPAVEVSASASAS